jgi:hypothetical protein
MTRHAPVQAKPVHRGAGASRGAGGAAGAKGAALAPPAYGVDFVDRLALSRSSGLDAPNEVIRRAAAEGIRTRSAELPYAAQIQRSFGHHDVSRVHAHVGPEATATAAAMNAAAYATGDHVVFAGEPSLHTAAHEAAHVMQQRAGVRLSGGVGAAGDAYERHADAVADAVVRGASSEALLQAAPSSSVASGGAVQRMVGFEMELSVPSLSERLAGSAEFADDREGYPVPRRAIKEFLLGGVEYDEAIGGTANPNTNKFKLKGDHSEDINRTPIIEGLRDKQVMWNVVYDDPEQARSNLEYVSAPINELGRGSDQLFNAQITSITTHMRETLTRARSGQMRQLPSPASYRYSTGLPLADFRDWLTRDEYDSMRGRFDDFLDRGVEDKIYLQATVGVLPRSLRRLHRHALAEAGRRELIASSAEQKALDAVDRTIDTLREKPEFKDHDYVKHLDPESKRAFEGVLHILFMYIVGDVLSQTSSFETGHVKNAVPFLIKMSPWHIFSKAGTQYLRNHPPEDDLVGVIGDFFETSKYAKLDYWLNEFDGGGKLSAKPREKKERLIKKRVNDTLLDFTPSEFIRNMIGTERTGVTVSGPSLDNPDIMHATVQGESSSQAGVPVEYRWIATYPRIRDLRTELWKIIDYARELSTETLTEGQRRPILSAVKPPPPPSRKRPFEGGGQPNKRRRFQ